MKPVREFQITQRNLPHWQEPGSVYFVTWRVVKGRTLSDSDRMVALDAIRFWHEKKWFVYAAVIMPDHVHILAKTLPIITNENRGEKSAVDLGDLVSSVKKFSARRINLSHKLSGSLWQDERYDRIQRDGREFEDTWTYIRENPVTAGLVSTPEQYKWLFECGSSE
jgi:putative transposase